jgi:hypothetical protein
MSRQNVTRLALAAVTIAAGSAVITLAVHAAVAQSTITACVGTGTGDPTMRYSSSGSCGVGQQAITWNQAGQEGPAGAQGPAGPPGPAGRDALSAAQVVVTTNSAINKNPVHSATATCPDGTRLLYGGVGLIGSSHPTTGRLVWGENRPQVGNRNAPIGWRAKASRHRPDHLADALLELVRAQRAEAKARHEIEGVHHHILYKNLVGGSLNFMDTAGPEWIESRAKYNSAVAAAKKAADLNPTAAWGVNAWAVCALS